MIVTASAWMPLTFFPVPLDDTLSDLEGDGVFHVLFVVNNYGGRKHNKLVVLFPDAFVLEDFAAVIGQSLLARLAKGIRKKNSPLLSGRTRPA